MTDGRFEKGRWVPDSQPDSPPSDQSNSLEERVAAARKSFGKGLDDILAIGHDLISTEEGRQHIGRTMDKATEDIMAKLEESAQAATDYINSIFNQKKQG